MLLRELITIYSENHMKPINVPYWENAKLLYIHRKTAMLQRDTL
jgi:hypothetical protein